jgi:hypothetical protein
MNGLLAIAMTAKPLGVQHRQVQAVAVAGLLRAAEIQAVAAVAVAVLSAS